MPELPEIETIRRGLERETVGRRVKSVEGMTQADLELLAAQFPGSKSVKKALRARLVQPG